MSSDRQKFEEAVWDRDIYTIKQLATPKAVKNKHCDIGLRLASRMGYLDIVEYLVTQGVDVNTESGYSVRWACHKGHLAVVKCLIDNGANINAREGSALRVAITEGHLDIIKYIFEYTDYDLTQHNDLIYMLTIDRGDLTIFTLILSIYKCANRMTILLHQRPSNPNQKRLLNYIESLEVEQRASYYDT